MKKKGLKAGQVMAFKATIAEAEQVEASTSAALIDASRTLAKDLLGEPRAAADLFARGFDGVDTKAVKALGLDRHFPDSDAALASMLEAIVAELPHYAGQLAEHDFGKSRHEALVKAAIAFRSDLVTRPVKAGQRQAGTAEREAVFGRLRYQTSWLRRCGRSALRTSKARVDFDRVQAKVVKPAKKTAGAPAPEAGAKTG